MMNRIRAFIAEYEREIMIAIMIVTLICMFIA